MIESRIVIWFEDLGFDLENVWFDFDLIWNFMIWFEIIPNHKKIRCYVVQCHCKQQTTILCIEVIGKMSISTNNWICPSLTDMSKGGQIVEALLFKMENNTDYWQLDIWAQQQYKN